MLVAYVKARFRVIAPYADLQEIVRFPGDAYFTINRTPLFRGVIQHTKGTKDILHCALAFLAQEQFVRIKPIEYVVHRQIRALVLRYKARAKLAS